jgi:CheY-like chemotaxis protein/predicted regulator of Ras-like GTPase activity (Roadblock/LC7/MglB family)
MGDVKQILVVDDHFEMLEFLRSMLQVSNKDHQVLAVPSAEEALLELRLTNFDLLISDVRLPGMSGFDLVRRARRLRPDIPVVMITAYSTEQGRAEADELGILRYFEKPLDTDGVLTVVHRALYGEQEPTPLAPVAAVTEVQVNLTDDMERRLDGLRADTGAFGLLLVAGGQVVYESGGHRGLHPDRIATIVNQKMGHSSMLAEELGGGDTAFNLLYQSGERYEIYTVNIGRSYFVTLLFEASARRGRIGTVWVFVQRAVKDLAQILPKLELGKVKEPPPAKPAPQQAEMATPPPVEIPRPEEIPPQPLPPPLPEPEPEPAPELEPTVLSEEEMAEFVGLFEGLETADTATDLDAFWDSALDEGDAAMPTRGISFEDAVKQGLLSSDFETKE